MTLDDFDILLKFVHDACTADEQPCPVTLWKSLNEPELLKKAIASLVGYWITAEGGTRAAWDEDAIHEVSDKLATEIEKKACFILLSRNLRLTSWALDLGRAFGFHPGP